MSNELKKLIEDLNKIKGILPAGSSELKRFDEGMASFQLKALKLSRALGGDMANAVKILRNELADTQRQFGDVNVSLASATNKLSELNEEFGRTAKMTEKVQAGFSLVSGSLFAIGSALKLPITGLDKLGKTFQEVDKFTLNYQNSIFLAGQKLKSTSGDFKTGTSAIKYYKDSVNDLVKNSKLGLPEATKLMERAFGGTSGLIHSGAQTAIRETAQAVAELGLTSEEAAKQMQELQEISNKYAQFRGRGITSGANQAMALQLFGLGKMSSDELFNIGAQGKKMSNAKAFGGKGFEGEAEREQATKIQERDAAVETNKALANLAIASSKVHDIFLNVEKQAAALAGAFTQAHAEIVAAGVAASKSGLVGSAISGIGAVGTTAANLYGSYKTIGAATKLAGAATSIGGGAAAVGGGVGAAGAAGAGVLGTGVGGAGLATGIGVALAAGLLAGTYIRKKLNTDKHIFGADETPSGEAISQYKKNIEIRKKREAKNRESIAPEIAGIKDVESSFEGAELSSENIKQYIKNATVDSYSLNQNVAQFAKENAVNLEISKGYEQSWEQIKQISTDFYMDAQKSTEALKNQNMYIEEQKKSIDVMISMIDGSLEKSREELEVAKNLGDANKVISLEKQIQGLESAKQERSNAKELENVKQIKNNLEAATKAVDIQLQFSEQNVQMVEAERDLHKEIRLGAGVSIQDTLKTAAAMGRVVKQERERAKILRDQAKSAKDIGEQRKLNFLAQQAEIKATQSETKMARELKSVREGYLDAFGESVFGAGEYAEFMPTTKSGVQAFAPTAGLGARFGSSVEAEMSAVQGDPLRFSATGGFNRDVKGWNNPNQQMNMYRAGGDSQYNSMIESAMLPSITSLDLQGQAQVAEAQEANQHLAGIERGITGFTDVPDYNGRNSGGLADITNTNPALPSNPLVQNIVNQHQAASGVVGGSLNGTIEIVLNVDGKRSKQVVTLDQLQAKGAQIIHTESEA